jgi:hypothetical protein
MPEVLKNRVVLTIFLTIAVLWTSIATNFGDKLWMLVNPFKLIRMSWHLFS